MVSALDSGVNGPARGGSRFEPCPGTFMCCVRGHSTLTVPLSTQVYEWVLVNLMLGGKPVVD